MAFPNVMSLTGADPGFHVGGGANPLGEAPTYDYPNFAKNCMKLRKFWAVGGGARRGCPLNPPLTYIHASESEILNTLQDFH